MPDATLYIRNPEVACVARGDAYMFIRPGGDPLIVSPAEVDALSDLMTALVSPMTKQDLLAQVDGELLDFLVSHEIVLEGSHEQLLPYMPLHGDEIPARPCGRLVFGLTGAVGSAQVASQIHQLSISFCDEVDVILTASAQKLVRPELIEYLGLRAWTDAFSPRGDINVPHIHLASRADLIVVMPASAHTLHKLAHGACSDLLSLTIAATTAPVVLVPAMNHAMWSHRAIARNVARLRQDGMYVVDPGIGCEVSRRAGLAPDREHVGGAGIRPEHLQLALTSILAAHRDGHTG